MPLPRLFRYTIHPKPYYRKSGIKYFSTTATAKRLNLEAKALFAKLLEVNYIVRESDKWALTAKGKLAGGRIKTSVKLGNYIEWPEHFDLTTLPAHQSPDIPVELVSATKIGKELGISANKLNQLLSELGWVNKKLKGWIATEHGLKQGAIQSEDTRTGIPYVKWPETITQSTLLLDSIKAIKGSAIPSNVPSNTSHSKDVAQYRGMDGHWLHSKAEMLINNWLYLAEIVHAYERKLPIDEEVYSGFYIPTGNVYIEYWNDDSDDLKYLAHKQKKLAIYQKYGFQLIQLNQDDVQNLDETLPRLLLKFGLQAY